MISQDTSTPDGVLYDRVFLFLDLIPARRQNAALFRLLPTTTPTTAPSTPSG